MQQYFAKNKSLELEESDYHHIKNVMRMKTGDLIKIVYNNTFYTCKLNVNKDVDFEIISEEKKNINKVKIISAFSLIKEQKLDYLLQKGAEVGIDYFVPINTKRSIVKIDSKKDSKKKDRWTRILKEASEQSFRSNIPVIENVLELNDLIKIEADLKLICSLNEKTENIKKVLEKNNKCDTILIVTGPEGGFELNEEKRLMENGFIPISLGNNVLRAETAPLVCASMINYEFMR